MKKVRKEVLSGEFGSMRYRLGVIENQIQDLGGSIVWENKLKEKQLRGDDSWWVSITIKEMGYFSPVWLDR